MRNVIRIATSSLALAGGLGLAGLGAAAVAEAQPIAPSPTYHWCPGESWNPGWGDNWDGGRCHDDFYGDRDHWQQGGPGDRDHWQQGGPGDRDHWQQQGGPPGDRH